MLNLDRHRDEGFATAQFVVLMGMTLILLAAFVQILLIENVRTRTMTALNEAAREGTKVTDLRRAKTSDPAAADQAILECKNTLSNAMSELNPSLTGNYSCSIDYDATNDLYYMRANVKNLNGYALVPGAQVFSGRIKNLSATYVPTEAAK